MIVALLLLALPCLYWTEGPESASAVAEAGIDRLCVPPDLVEAWGALGVTVTPLTAEQAAAREALLPPGALARAGRASPTRAPWIVANGWRFLRDRSASYLYDVPTGGAALAAAEAFAYGVDAVLKVDPADLPALAEMFAFLRQVPSADLPDIADFGVMDDGSPLMGEVMNLLVRRNLLFDRVAAPVARYPFTVRLDTPEYSRADAADPSAFALAVRRRLTDPRRTLRLYGSEVVIARLTGGATRVRVHLLNYGGRTIDGLRVRVRGAYPSGHVYVAGIGRVGLEEHVVLDEATEFSIPTMTLYAVVDLIAAPR